MKTINEKLLNCFFEEIKLNNYVTEEYLKEKYLVCERTVRRYIKILKIKGIIKLEGYGIKRKWIVLKDYSN